MTAQQQVAHDPRVQPGQCGAERVIGGAAFVCISPPHDSPPDRARLVWDPKPAAHYFIRRYPR